jgi:hypothetical protein
LQVPARTSEHQNVGEILGTLGERLEPGARLWRFMDFTKFVSMLHCRGLFFSRADELPDPFEGLTSRRSARRDERQPVDAAEDLRSRVFLSCWHQNEHESAAMWRIYLSANEGIAIKSTAARLRASLVGVKETLHFGLVRYVDDWPPACRDELDAFFCKRKSFDYEREARVLLCSPNFETAGVYLSADLDTLIEEVVVAPMAESWFAELVASVSKRYDLELSVTRSTLFEAPGDL